MSRILLALLVCLPALALGSTINCRLGEKVLNPGETHVIEENCARHNCTCDPTKSGSEMCQTEMTGCFNRATNTCYKSGEPATINSTSGSALQCVCLQQGRSFSFADCRSETCKDSRTNEEKKKGESVNRVIDGVNYVCTCAGTEGYQKCRNKADLDNADKCKDIEGKYIEKGQRYRVQYGDKKYDCLCDGNNSGKECSVV